MNTRLVLLSSSLLAGLIISGFTVLPVAGPPQATEPTVMSVPVGAILVWWGTYQTIPENFEICDGRSPVTPDATFRDVKPDLRGQFIRGAETPSSFQPRANKGGGKDKVNLKDHVIDEGDLPKHTHPMPHAHEAGSHVHAMEHDHSLGSHVHPLGDHAHDIGTHTHPLGGQWVQGSLSAGTKFYLEQSAPKDSASTSASTLDETGNIKGSIPNTGTGSGTVGAASNTTTDAADGTTGAASPGSTNENAGQTPPLHEEHDPEELDNRPAFLDVLYIIRVK